ncbi:GFA family protein [Nitratireductor sp. CAU 1489]|uniref:GFA family protein n=1 Tax=Nitratireductor arenosus TaxID=2682096 RepID=A0A844QK28_9HYPH|nr:GFA family protein [Nitratireductor arenosus]MVA99655.1 GFA family protein [Nitratireductor arenosus]
MSLDNKPVYTGGCQCGAVRFRVEGALGEASVCHCRMCQKAAGNFFLPLVSVRTARLDWTRAEPKRFRSSNHVQRGFCEKCGTPLTYEAPDGVALAIAAFDHPDEIAPVVQWGVEARLPYVDGVHGLPGHTTLEDEAAGDFLREIHSFQHPDHDTDTWPPQEETP